MKPVWDDWSVIVTTMEEDYINGRLSGKVMENGGGRVFLTALTDK